MKRLIVSAFVCSLLIAFVVACAGGPPAIQEAEYIAGGAAAPTPTPTPVPATACDPTGSGTPECLLWFKADGISGLSDGDPVITWPNDGSEGAGQNADCDKVGDPTWETNELNGEPIVRFNGTNNYCTITDFPYNLTGLTAFAVVKQATQGNFASVFGHWDQGTNERAWFIDRDSTANDGRARDLVSSDGTISNRLILAGGLRPKTNWYIQTYKFEPNTLSLYLNGFKQNGYTSGSNGTAASIFNSSADLSIGTSLSSGSPTSLFNGDIAELLMFDSALSDANRAIVEEILSDKYLLAQYGTGDLWNPTMLGPVAWFASEQGGENFFANNDLVGTWTSWHDLGVSSFNATQSTGSAKPTFKTNVQNGRPIVDFDGGDWLDIAFASLNLDPSVNNITIFAVADLDTEAATAVMLGQLAGTKTAKNWIGYLQSTDKLATFMGTNLEWSSTYGGTPYLHDTVSLPTGKDMVINGGTPVTDSDVPPGSTGAYYFGRGASASFYWNGPVASLLIFNGAMSAADRTLLRLYLNTNWAIY
jgi:hypothetical protein